ncbi:ATP-dependent protease ClpP protease subunit [Bradyrhizobium sp. USDA 377]
MADVNELPTAEEHLARPRSDETIYTVWARPRSKQKALPVLPNLATRPEGREPALTLKFYSKVPRGIDLALGQVPERDTDSFVRAISGAGNRSIHCEIDCAGGDGRSALAIAVALLQHPYSVRVRIVGRCSSGAVYIALAADHRSIVPDGSVLIHRTARICVRSQFESLRKLPAADLEAMNNSLSDLDDVFVALLTARLGVSEEVARRWMIENRKWSATEALERGFVNVIEGTT